jgi:dynein heavy chain
MSKEITDLTKWQPTIEILANQSLKERHWDDIKKLTDSQFNHRTLSLNLWFKLAIPPQSLENVAEISDKAKKQSRLEDMLISMENEWKTKEFELTKFGDAQIPILQGSIVEEMQITLDEHVLISQTIVTNPDVTPIYQRASDWANLMQFT